ncbi:major facilitator superfamily MFS_1 [Pseudopedobacter saltans DSM 12145]|uniref:Major facilitator superfamily MFS_1 n=1 Tax=Pseudopedobacter saltans (strain ATCC 51119 / DSM 12145 / JCM 21818 / CCUG 39354 / LMG 10337 / NBRC 100064 / NCIMB 13643) TaxID=762903 RepID=F0S7Y8_PSESL|nr:MFS transporter [Pseudopedobacter saltans]ADY51209.1 major facilitator superfamily MFS_1 [Pseudopedobacter saltans DSM 12145]
MEEEKKQINWGVIIAVIGVFFISSNLRAAITSVGPVISEISAQLNMNKFQSGLVTTIPLLAFGFLSALAPKFASKIGIEKVLGFSMLVLTAGLLIRIQGNVPFLFLGAALIGTAIAMGNVLMPAFIKDKFPKNLGLVTGIFTVSMNLIGALAAGYSIRMGHLTGWGWKGSIGVWFILSLIAFAVWIPQLINSRKSQKTEQNIIAEQKRESFSSLLRSPLAWCITLFMGLQSCLFYMLVAWLPIILQDWGMTKEQSGWTFSYVQLAQLPVTFIGPILAVKMKNQAPLVWLTAIALLLGTIGIVFFKTTYIVPSVLAIGFSGGLAFSLVMMFFVLRTKSSIRAAQLSGMAQSFGYLIAACSPPLFGLIYDLTLDWTYPLLLYFLLSFSLLGLGLIASRNKYV